MIRKRLIGAVCAVAMLFTLAPNIELFSTPTFAASTPHFTTNAYAWDGTNFTPDSGISSAATPDDYVIGTNRSQNLISSMKPTLEAKYGAYGTTGSGGIPNAKLICASNWNSTGGGMPNWAFPGTRVSGTGTDLFNASTNSWSTNSADHTKPSHYTGLAFNFNSQQLLNTFVVNMKQFNPAQIDSISVWYSNTTSDWDTVKAATKGVKTWYSDNPTDISAATGGATLGQGKWSVLGSINTADFQNMVSDSANTSNNLFEFISAGTIKAQYIMFMIHLSPNVGGDLVPNPGQIYVSSFEAYYNQAIPQNSALETSSATYSLTNPTPTSIVTDLNQNALTSIVNGSHTLVRDTEYTVTAIDTNRSTITFSDSYLQTLPFGDYPITINFSGGVPSTFNLSVTTASSSLSPASVVYNMVTKPSISTTITYLEGSTLTSITEGPNIVPSSNYTVSNDVVTFKDSYLQSLTQGDHALSFNFSAGMPQPFMLSVTAPNSLISPIIASYVSSQATPISTTITFNGNSVASVNDGTQTLPSSAYSVNGNVLTFSPTYLSTLDIGGHAYVINFTAGNPQIFTLTVTAVPVATGIDFNYWNVQLPYAGSRTVKWDSLMAGYNDPYFYTAQDGAQVLMDPKTGGATSGSAHPRSEMSEINPANNHSGSDWGNNYYNTMTATVAVTKLGLNKSGSGKTAIGQIHSTNSNGGQFELFYVIDPAHPGSNLALLMNNTGFLPISIPLGQYFTYTMSYTNGAFSLYVNGVEAYNSLKSTLYDNTTNPPKQIMPAMLAGYGFYFKAGNYDQNATTGAVGIDPFSIVQIKSLSVDHGGQQSVFTDNPLTEKVAGTKGALIYGNVGDGSTNFASQAVNYTINGIPGSIITDMNGDYSFPVISGSKVVITPSYKANYTSSSAITLDNVTENTMQDLKYSFTAPVTTYTVSGNLSGATVSSITYTINGGSVQTTPVDSSGNYTIPNVVYGANVVITPPAISGYVVNHLNITKAITADSAGNNFTYSQLAYTISGNLSGATVSSVTYTINGGPIQTAPIDSSGNYTITNVVYGANVVITPPTISGYSVSPLSYSLTNVTAPVTGKNFTYSYSVIGITVSGSATAAVGTPSTYTATVTPANATNNSVTWSVVQGTGSATISPSGVLTPVSAGTVTVKATSTDGSNISGSMSVTIAAQTVPITGISVSSPSTTIYVNDNSQFTATVTPTNATNTNVTWSVADGVGIATINSNGLLTAIGAGTVTVKATANDGSGISSTFVVTIIKRSSGRSGSGITPTPAPTPDATPAPTPNPTPGATAPPVITVTPGQPVVDLNNPESVKAFKEVIVQKLLSASNVSGKFTDTTTSWAAESIKVVAKLGAVTGYQDGSFKPDASITRGEFATMIEQIFAIAPADNKSVQLTDISNNWAKDAIVALASNGIINGYDDGTFRSDKPITREEMIAIISRVVNLNGAKQVNTQSFSDINTAWAKDAIEAAAKAGIVNGTNDHSFAPEKNTTRAEAITILVRTIKLIPEIASLLDALK